jgi:carboxyl-terminal processing protease
MEDKPKLEAILNKTLKNILVVLVVIVIALGSFAGGFVTGHFVPITSISGLQDPTVPSTTSPEQQSATPSEFQTLFTPFWETWTLIHENYVEQPVDDLALMRGAINGMMDTLDVGRNYYYDPRTMADQITAMNRKYEGIGAYVDVETDYLTVVSPIKGSPADQAGLRAGDQIIAIDGADMTGIPPVDARQKVLGPDGTVVTLTILRKDVSAPFDVKITRAKIVNPLIEYEMRPDGIGYIRLISFGDTADPELKKALKELLAQNPKGLILDLRYNLGGDLFQSIAVASEFLPNDKVVVYEKYGDGSLKPFMSVGDGVATDIPLVVLVNQLSASASEIVAGSLQDYGRAKLIGTQSYGKGSVQSFVQLQNDQGAVGVTFALWLTPNKHSIDHLGLAPDIFVNYTQADFDANRDPQLDAAVQTLLAIVNGSPLPTSMPTPVTTHVPTP